MTVTGLGLAEERLALAVDAAQLGCWLWDLESGITTWDERLEAMHGLPPGGFGGSYEDWLRSMHPADRQECVRRVEAALENPGPYLLLHRTIWPDGSVHAVECRGTVLVDEGGHPIGTTGVAIDVTSRERVVQTLQQTLLPRTFPSHPGVRVAARYRAATGPTEIGGDWYAIVALPDRQLGIAIGDVAGHGLGAIADMAAARFSLRALALTDLHPGVVLEKLNRVVQVFESDSMITALYGVIDLDAMTWTYASAGHVPAVLRHDDGTTTILDTPTDPPLGVATGTFREHTTALDADAALLLYTDGLVERRGESLSTGIERVAAAMRSSTADPERLCDRVTEQLLGPGPHDDDVAVVAAVLDPETASD